MLDWSEVAEPEPARMLRWYAALVAERHRHPDLTDDRFDSLAVETGGRRRLARLVPRGPLRVVANLVAEPGDIPVAGLGPESEVVLAWDEAGTSHTGGVLHLPGHSVAIIPALLTLDAPVEVLPSARALGYTSTRKWSRPQRPWASAENRWRPCRPAFYRRGHGRFRFVPPMATATAYLVDVHDDAQCAAVYAVIMASRTYLRPWDDSDGYEPTVDEWRYEDPSERTEKWAVQEDGQVVGVTTLFLSMDDNTDKIWAELDVHPDHRGRGAGTALAQVLERRARELGRPEILVEVYLPPDVSGEHPYERFAAAQGYPRSARNVRILDLPIADGVLDRLAASARERWDEAYRWRRARTAFRPSWSRATAASRTSSTSTPRPARSTSRPRRSPRSATAGTSTSSDARGGGG